MKKFVVAFISFFDNIVIMELVEAETPRDAILNMKTISEAGWYDEGTDEFPQEMEDIKDFFFNGDAAVNVFEIPANG